jgi:hypothetical protein
MRLRRRRHPEAPHLGNEVGRGIGPVHVSTSDMIGVVSAIPSLFACVALIYWVSLRKGCLTNNSDKRALHDPT